jgi:hypothetical protein
MIKRDINMLEYLCKVSPKEFTRKTRESGPIRTYFYRKWIYSPMGGFETWDTMAEVNLEKYKVTYYNGWGKR